MFRSHKASGKQWFNNESCCYTTHLTKVTVCRDSNSIYGRSTLFPRIPLWRKFFKDLTFLPKSRSLSSVARGSRVPYQAAPIKWSQFWRKWAKILSLRLIQKAWLWNITTMVSFEKKVGRRHEIYLKCKGDMNAKAAFFTSFLTMTSWKVTAQGW